MGCNIKHLSNGGGSASERFGKHHGFRLMGILWDTMEDQPVIVSGTGDVPFPLRHYWSVLYTRFQPYQMWYGAK